MLFRVLGSLAMAVVIMATGFYFYMARDGAACDRACVAESGEEP